MVLPQDVVDYIFSFLRTDPAALKSCTQAHPLLSRLAERHLYHRTSLDIKPGCDLDIAQLSSLLEKNPRIRHYICSLTINISELSASLVSAWTPVMKPMSSILTSLPRLNKITLSSPIEWIKFQEKFRSAFANILHQSSVTEVHLEGFVPHLSILNTCQNIKTLSVSKYAAKEFKQPDLTSPSQHLESLSIRSSDSPNLFDWAISRIGSLTSLTLRPQRMEFNGLPKILEACARSLTSLDLDMHFLGQSEDFPSDGDFYSTMFGSVVENENVKFPFTLSVLSNLKHITIRTVIWAVCEELPNFDGVDGKIECRDFVFYSALHAIARLIELSAPSLRQVVLKIYCHDFSAIDSLVEIDWEPLILLGGSPTCPHIDLCISCREIDANREVSITNTLAMHTGLMQLVNLGVFSIKPETKGG